MRIFFIPVRKDALSNLVIIAVLLLLVVSLNLTDATAVFGSNPAKPIYQGDADKPVIAFECNVVWGTEFIEPMLDILRDKDVKITFFIGGEWAKDNPELLKRIAEEGHELGNHGYGHKYHSKLDFGSNQREIKQTEEIVYKTTGIETRLFAPPYGDYNDTTVRAAESLGYKTIMWSIDTIDWRRDGVSRILERVFKKPHNGAFVLMHPTPDTVKALPQMIDELRSRGFRIGTISEALN